MEVIQNQFIDNLYHEFEQKLFKEFGLDIEDLKERLDRDDTNEKRGQCMSRLVYGSKPESLIKNC